MISLFMVFISISHLNCLLSIGEAEFAKQIEEKKTLIKYLNIRALENAETSAIQVRFFWLRTVCFKCMCVFLSHFFNSKKHVLRQISGLNIPVSIQINVFFIENQTLLP